MKNTRDQADYLIGNQTSEGAVLDNLNGLLRELDECRKSTFRLIRTQLDVTDIYIAFKSSSLNTVLGSGSGELLMADLCSNLGLSEEEVLEGTSLWRQPTGETLVRRLELIDSCACSLVLQLRTSVAAAELSLGPALEDIIYLFQCSLKLSLNRRAAALKQIEVDRLLKLELTHRTGNMLAVLQAIALQTLRYTPDPVDFAATFTGRLHALSAAYALVSKVDWSSVELSSVIRTQLMPYPEMLKDRLEVLGDDIMVSSDAALALSVIIHELITNAIKFGALSQGEGRVTVQLQPSGEFSPSPLEIEWIEHGGPKVSKDLNPRYGMRTVLQGLDKFPGSSVVIETPPAGLRAKMSLLQS